MKLRLFYDRVPNAPLFQEEFGFYCLDRWIGQGYLKKPSEVADYGKYLRDLFGYDEPEAFTLGGLGGCEAPFLPCFSSEVLEDRGSHELVRDSAGRHVLYFKGRRNGFMPEYVDHPVKDMASWERECLWRLNPETPERIANAKAAAVSAKNARAAGNFVTVYIVGGYMYLRSLIGPLELLYAFYDHPQLIHACMKAWLAVMERIIGVYQSECVVDRILFDEDICYNGGSLISDSMFCEFLLPYYETLLHGMRLRQTGRLHVHLATDGRCNDVMERYISLGFDYFSPFEAASGCDVVEIGKKYPDILITGGIDKRILASDFEAIDRMCDYILPAMKKRGGYIPTCDHGVPEEVPFENYLHYRKRCLEFSR